MSKLLVLVNGLPDAGKTTVGLGPTIRIDTTRATDLAALAARIRAAAG